MERKDFIKASMIASAGLTLPINAFTTPVMVKSPIKNLAREKLKVCLFSKQLNWLNYQDMAHFVADLGYDGIDLTIRNGGHVLPEKVETDLPKAVEAAHKAGINILMVSTDIDNAHEPTTERILKTLASIKIPHYRSGAINYKKDLSVQENLELIKKKYVGLVELNQKYGLYSDYLNHADDAFGASLWDLWYTLKDLDPKYIGSQFDIKHATIAGPYNWPVTLELMHKYVKTFVVRDFVWKKDKDVWAVNPVPLGEGMVDFKRFFGLIKQYGITGPISLMCDYDLGGVQDGAKILTIPKSTIAAAMKKDLDTLRGHLKAYDL